MKKKAAWRNQAMRKKKTLKRAYSIYKKRTTGN